MKVIKGLVLFGFLGAFMSGCFDPPEYSNSPKISFNDIKFKVTPNPSHADTLILYIDFNDGDGDMGLTSSQTDDPFHERNFYFEDAVNFKIVPVGTVMQGVNAEGLPQFIPMIVTPPTGKLVTKRTRNKSGFGFLPPFSAGNLDCRDYTTSYLLISPTAKDAIDSTYYIERTLTHPSTQEEYYLLQDTIYFERNLNHYNILVRFYQSSGGPFTEFSWEDEYCTTFNGRFPVLTANEGSPLEGTIRYSMISTGFTSVFSVKNLRLDVTVKDRALNEAFISTPEFTLAGIRVN